MFSRARAEAPQAGGPARGAGLGAPHGGRGDPPPRPAGEGLRRAAARCTATRRGWARCSSTCWSTPPRPSPRATPTSTRSASPRARTSRATPWWRGARHRRGHPRRGAAAHLRSLLHHQAGGRGHRAGAVHLPRASSRPWAGTSRATASRARAPRSGWSCPPAPRGHAPSQPRPRRRPAALGAARAGVLVIDDEPLVLTALCAHAGAASTTW